MQNQSSGRSSGRSKVKSFNLNSTNDCSKMLLTKKGLQQAMRNHSCSMYNSFNLVGQYFQHKTVNVH
jgi:hypothetical protein